MNALKKSTTISPLCHIGIAEKTSGQSSSVLKLIYEFQSQPTIQELFSVYAENIHSVLPINGIRYRFPLLGIHFVDGLTRQAICNYQLTTEHEIWGDITIYRNHPFTEKELHQFKLITSLLVHPLKSAIIQASSSMQTDDGGVVGYPNPELVDQLITREAKLAARQHVPMSIVLFNVDRFNSICRTSGRIHGDKILYELMQVMCENVRNTDLLFRYHSDTYCLILNGIGGANAEVISGRVRHVIDKHNFSHANDKSLHITVSAGVAELLSTDSLDSIVSRANNALSLAKKSGRNHSVLADGRFVA